MDAGTVHRTVEMIGPHGSSGVSTPTPDATTLAGHAAPDRIRSPMTGKPSIASWLGTTGCSGGSHGTLLGEVHPLLVLSGPAATGGTCYSRDSVWVAPRRHLRRVGGGAISALLRLEFAAMIEPEWTPLRSAAHGPQVVDEYALRFRYRGGGIEGVDLPVGALVELHRIRILRLDGCVIRHEASVETWAVVAACERADPAGRVPKP